MSVHGFGEGVEAEEGVVEAAGDGEVDPGVGGARGGHAGVAVEAVSQHFVHVAGVGDLVLEVECFDIAQSP